MADPQTVATGNWGQQSGGGGNLLGMMGDAMKLRNTQQEWNARMMYGRIQAGANSPEEGLAEWEKSGMSGFVPELATQARQAALLGAQTTVAKTEAAKGQFALNTEAFASLARVGLQSTTPEDFERNYRAAIGLLPESSKRDPVVQKAAQDYYDSRMHGLPAPGDPKRNAAYHQRWLASNGALVTPQMRENIFGVPTSVDTPAGTVFGMRNPVDGSVTYAPGQMALPGTAGNQRTPVEEAPPPVSGTGKPLYGPELVNPKYATGQLTLGPKGPMISQQDYDFNQDLTKQFGAQLNQYRASQNVMGQAASMETELEHLAGAGENGLLTPGTALPQRAALAKAINTFYQARGKTPPFDPTKVSAAEGLFKAAQNMAFQFRDQVEEGSRQSVTSLIAAGASVPGAENSYLGAKLLIAATKVGAQRIADERTFLNWWKTQHNGLLLGGPEAFNARNPYQDYTTKMFADFGLDGHGQYPEGQAGVDTVGRMVGQGLLTKTEAASILKSQKAHFGLQ